MAISLFCFFSMFKVYYYIAVLLTKTVITKVSYINIVEISAKASVNNIVSLLLFVIKYYKQFNYIAIEVNNIKKGDFVSN